MTELNEKSVFLAALELADGCQRAAYLNKACSGNSLFRKRIEALLVEHERSGQFLSVPVLEQLAAGQDSQESEVTITTQGSGNQPEPIDFSFLEPSDEPNSLGKLGHYEVRQLIGRGGCGIVLKGFDTKLERIVAIKVMYSELASTSPARKRFLREARATAAIRHKNVVSIYAVEERPLPYLVMELIDGPTLQQKINAIGPLELNDILEIGQQAAAGLAAAHAKGLIHRDIKPANILLEGNSNEVKLTDFGLARSADDASITQSGIISGTPLYMSPEQAQGEEIDARSDLFSLGSVLYVMSSGRPPFRAKTTLAVLRRVVEDHPRPIQQIIPEVPDWLVTIIDILLGKEPDRRFASAKEVASLLQNCHDALAHHQTVRLPPEVLKKAGPQPPDKTIARPQVLKRPITVAGILVVLIGLAVLAISQSSGRSSLPITSVDDPTNIPAVTHPLRTLDPSTNTAPFKPVTEPPAEVPVIERENEAELAEQQPAYIDRTGERFGDGVWVNDGAEFIQTNPEPASIYFGDPNWTDYDVSVEMKTLSKGPRSQGGSLFIRAHDDGNRYSFTPGNYNNQGIDLAYRHNGQFGRDGTYRPGAYENNRWYKMQAEVRGRSIRVWLDDKLMFQTDNPHFPSGRIGLATWNSIVRWRNLTVTDPDGKLLWKGFPIGDTKTLDELSQIAVGNWHPLLRTQEEFDRVLAASPKLNESDGAYAKYMDGVIELHAKNLYFTEFIARNAIIRAKIRKLAGSWGGFYLRSNDEHIAVYSEDGQQFHVWLFDGKHHIRLADFRLEQQKTGFFELAFATIDDSILVFVEGRKVYEKSDQRATNLAGLPALRASHALPRSTFQFKDVEIMTLDPLLTVEKRKQLDAIQWACRHGIKIGALDEGGYVTYGPRFLPVLPPSGEIVDVDMAGATDFNLSTVERLQNLSNVQRSVIGPASADDELLLALLHSPWASEVEQFDMRNSDVTDNFFEHLNDLSNLRGIGFSNTQISSAALKHVLPLTFSEIRAAGCPNIDNQACEILASQPRWTYLDFKDTAIDDQGLKQLTICSQLEYLDVSGCNVTEAAVKELVAAMPQLKVVWDGGILDPAADPTVGFINSYGMPFALIPSGKAWLGGGDGKPGNQEVVFTEDFYLGTTEVTQQQWHAVMSRNPSYFQKAGPQAKHRSPGAEAVDDLTYEELQKLPVEMVSWLDVQRFLTKLNEDLNEEGWTYRLPTEHQWEYACRNGPMTSKAQSAFSYYFAEGTNHLKLDQANVGNRLARTKQVASYAPNQLGLYDMHGNLYEWCHDTVATANGEIRHPVRGGGYYLGPDQNKATKRNLDPPDFRNYLSGFRVARVKTSKPSTLADDPGKKE